ncbi:MAG: hydroxyisourate hydrolase [Gemmatimonadales bacterium]
MPNDLSVISTHVLDTKRGEPAAGVNVTLWRMDGKDKVLESSQTTDDDGRIANLLSGDLTTGSYRIAFDVHDYFDRHGDQARFITNVVLNFDISTVDRSYHVPLLVSPFSCTSYRGS